MQSAIINPREGTSVQPGATATLQSEPLSDPVERPEDQRRWPRQEHRRTVQIHPLEHGVPGKAVPARIIDFSAMGIGLIHSRKMASGDQFVVPLGTLGGTAVPLLYTVVRCRGPKNGLYSIGGELVSVMDLQRFNEAVPDGITVGEYIRSLL